MRRRTAVLFLAALFIAAGSLASPASPAAAAPVDPPYGEYFTLSGPTPDEGHQTCGEFGCKTEGNFWTNDSGYFTLVGCTGFGSANCQFYRNAGLVIDTPVNVSISVQLFFYDQPMGSVVTYNFALSPNAFGATYGGAIWEDGTDATSAVTFARSYLVHAGTNPLLGECVPQSSAQPTDSFNPVDGPNCIDLGNDVYRTKSLGFGLPSW
ncbi:MAG: hypothetical protein WCI74_08570, partial [Actinomycetes bacterium]